jgi:hypothetical protein
MTNHKHKIRRGQLVRKVHGRTVGEIVDGYLVKNVGTMEDKNFSNC